MVKEKGKRKKEKVKPLITTIFLLPFTFCLAFTLRAAPATQPAADVRAWFDQLTDTSPEVRDAALDRLLSLTPDDLPTLQRVVSAGRPLQPSQRSALPEIVYQVFKSGIPYEAAEGQRGFLGIELGWVEFDLNLLQGHGVMVIRTEEGFASHRLLRPGDRIRAIIEPEGFFFTDHQRFVLSIQTLRAGDQVVLEIDREGKILRIPITLRARPAGLENEGALANWRAQMQAQADEYWKENFSRLVDEPGPPFTRLPAADARQE